MTSWRGTTKDVWLTIKATALILRLAAVFICCQLVISLYELSSITYGCYARSY